MTDWTGHLASDAMASLVSGKQKRTPRANGTSLLCSTYYCTYLVDGVREQVLLVGDAAINMNPSADR
jgi:hypothetical protein